MPMGPTQRGLIRITRNEKYLPKHMRTVLNCIKEGYRTSHSLSELNPLKVKVKKLVNHYGKINRQLYDFGFVSKEKVKISDRNCSGYEYYYYPIELTPVRLDPTQYLDI